MRTNQWCSFGFKAISCGEILENVDPSSAGRSLSLRAATDHVKLIQIEDGVLADYLPQMIWIVSAKDRNLLYGNPSFFEYFGSIGPGWEKRSERFHSEDLKLIEDAFESIRRTGVTPKAEVRILDAGGGYRWHKMRLVPVRHKGDICEWVVTAFDIDDMVQTRKMLQEASALFGLSQEAAGAGSWELSLREGRVKLSRESALLHGVGDHAFEMDLAGWERIVDPDDAKTVLVALQAAVDKRTTFNGEFRVQMADGSQRWLSGIGRAYYDEGGEPVRMIGLNFDITARKNIELALHKANAEAQTSKQLAEQASTAKSDFLASMSHEIRTPLNSIIGYTDLLMEDVDHGSPIRRKLEVVQESGAALLTIVNDILDFSKIEAGQIDLDPIVFSPRALVENVCSMLLGIAHRKRISLVRQIASDVPHFVVGDEGRLRQILLNLVNNAVKFTEKGLVSICVTRIASNETFESATIRFSVKDSGIGIAPEQQQRLFQRFSQVDASINRRFGGSGLGLAICKQLVDLMQGEITVQSREGEGSTFSFHVDLPVADAPENHRNTAYINNLTPTRSVRILLVEDIIVNQELAKAVLERAGHMVDVASNGKEAIEAVQRTHYDVILMDVQMPVMDGLTATRAIRALEPPRRNVPIIAMTANVLPQQVVGLKTAGMDDHVGKPFRRPELLATIERWSSQPTSNTSSPVKEDKDRFDTDVFNALEDLIGEASFRVCVAKFSAELAVRLTSMSPALDDQLLANDAHALIQPVGLFGFIKMLALLRQVEAKGTSTDISLFGEIEKERQLVIADLDRYLVTSGGRLS